MARLSSFKSNFSAGKITELLEARVESDAYQNGAAEILNMIVKPQGAAQNRAGTEFIARTKFQNKVSVLKDFVFSQEDSAVLEFGDLYIRVFADGGPVVEAAKTVTGITQANPGVVTCAGHGYSDGRTIYLDAVGGMDEVSGKPFLVSAATTNTFALQDLDGNNVNTTGYGAYTSGGTAELVFEITTTYAEAHLKDLQFAQSGDIIWICHPSYKPRKLSRTGATSWTLADYAPSHDPFTSTNNYPRTVCFYEQRLVFGGTNAHPQKIFASQAGDYENMLVGTTDSDGYEYTIASRQINGIKWLFPDKFLMIGTNGGIFVMRGSGYDQALTPSNVQIKRQISQKAGNVVPELIQNVVMFVQRLGEKVVGARYDGNGDEYTGRDATIRSIGITEGGITDIAYQEEPDSILWLVRSDGKLVAATAEFAEEVLAWHEHETQGEFESVCVKPGTDRDELWLQVKRTIGGNTRRYVELMRKRIDDVQEDGYFVDCGLTYEGSAATVMTGLEHLEGKTVKVLADGAAHPDRVVSGGQITLARSATKVHIGLGYTSRIKSLRIGTQSPNGTAQGKRRKITRVVTRLYRTLGLKIGRSVDKLETIPFRSAAHPMDAPPPTFTGDREIGFQGDWDTEGRIVLQQDQPLPFTVLGYSVEYEVNDG